MCLPGKAQKEKKIMYTCNLQICRAPCASKMLFLAIIRSVYLFRRAFLNTLVTNQLGTEFLRPLKEQ